SVVMVAVNYNLGARSAEREAQSAGESDPVRSALRAPRSHAGKVAGYARGADYHEVLRQRLNQLLAAVQAELPGCPGRGGAGTARWLERDCARRAGLGWFGKNTMLLNKRLGSYFFLGALLLSAELRPDPPHQTSHCGSCTACLDACPTQAFPAPGVLDSRRC